MRYTGADGAMIARGALGSPWIFRDAARALRGEEPLPPPKWTERIDVALRQFELAAKYKSERIACLEARKHYAWYLKGVPHAGYWKGEISKITTLEDGNTFAICNCQPQSCMAIGSATYYGTPNMVRSNYVAEIDKDKCVACGQCVEVCPVGALT